MMTKIRFFSSLGLLFVLLAACAPATSPVAPVDVVTAESTPTLLPSTPTAGPTDALAPTPLAVATSRGPNLEATDPLTVSLAAGQLQLVEFFRFT
jgi:hypothetical protein